MHVTLLATLLSLISLDPIAPPADYAGRWSLDLKASTGLPAYYDRVKSHMLTVTQTPEELDVVVTTDAGRENPDTVSFRYVLNGAEMKTTSTIRTQAGPTAIPTTLRAIATADGDVHISITRSIPMGGATITAVSAEDWHLSDDRRTLTVHRTDESPRGKTDAMLVFQRTT